MPTAPPGGAVLAPASSGDGKEVITSTNTTVRLLSCFHDFSYYESTNFFLANIFSNSQNWEKDAFFYQQKVCFLFQLKNFWEKVRRLVVWKFVKTCRDLDNSYKAWIFPEKNGLKLRTPELDPKQPLLSREPLLFTLLSKLRTQFLLCTSIAKKVKVKYRFF